MRLHAPTVGSHRHGNGNTPPRVRYHREPSTARRLHGAPSPDRASPPLHTTDQDWARRQAPWGARTLSSGEVCHAPPPCCMSSAKSTHSRHRHRCCHTPPLLSLSCQPAGEEDRRDNLDASVPWSLSSASVPHRLRMCVWTRLGAPTPSSPSEDRAAAAATIVHGKDEVGHRVYAAVATVRDQSGTRTTVGSRRHTVHARRYHYLYRCFGGNDISRYRPHVCV